MPRKKSSTMATFTGLVGTITKLSAYSKQLTDSGRISLRECSELSAYNSQLTYSGSVSFLGAYENLRTYSICTPQLCAVS